MARIVPFVVAGCLIGGGLAIAADPEADEAPESSAAEPFVDVNQRVTQQLAGALREASALTGCQIKVKFRGGAVRLEGTVTTSRQRVVAGAIVERNPQVTHVVNLIDVSPDPSLPKLDTAPIIKQKPSPPQPQEQRKAAPAGDKKEQIPASNLNIVQPKQLPGRAAAGRPGIDHSVLTPRVADKSSASAVPPRPAEQVQPEKPTPVGNVLQKDEPRRGETADRPAESIPAPATVQKLVPTTPEPALARGSRRPARRPAVSSLPGARPQSKGQLRLLPLTVEEKPRTINPPEMGGGAPLRRIRPRKAEPARRMAKRPGKIRALPPARPASDPPSPIASLSRGGPHTTFWPSSQPQRLSSGEFWQMPPPQPGLIAPQPEMTAQQPRSRLVDDLTFKPHHPPVPMQLQRGTPPIPTGPPAALRAVQNEPAPRINPRRLHRRIMDLLERRRYDEAITICAAVLRRQKDNVNALAYRGMTYAAMGDTDAAMDDFNEAIRIAPDFSLPYRERGKVHKNLGRDDLALRDVTAAVRANPADVEAWCLRADTHLHKNENAHAFSAADRALKHEGKRVDALSIRGEALRRLGKLKEAVAGLSQALKHDPDHARSLAFRGTALLNLGRFDEAIRDLDHAVRINDKSAFAYLQRAEVHRKLSNTKAALADYTQAIRLKPNSAQAYAGRGMVQLKLKQYQQAVADYNKAIRFNPDNASAYYDRGKARNELGQQELAVADYQRAVDLNPIFADAFYDQ